MIIHIKFKVNGVDYDIKTENNKRLLDVLRDDLRLTGTKEGCGIGECGACTIIMDGEAVNSCMVLAGRANNTEIMTVEGLEKDGELSTLQDNFVKMGAVQCGFCTPGMLMSAKALLMKNPDPTVEEIKEAIAGNLCRCTGYTQIVEAIKKTGEENR